MTKILLVEDDKSLREIYGVRLLAEGYDIVSAGDGEDALAMAIKEKPTLIISDVMMPKISGFDMLDILRSTTETRDIKVIMMTALSSDDQRARGEQLGADKYLVKSQVGIEDVVRTVHEVLGDTPGASGIPTAQATPQADAAAPVAVAAAAVAASEAVTPTTPEITEAPAPAETPAVAPATEETTDPVASSPGNEAAGPLPPQPALTETSLPQPTAPFASPRPTNLGERVIQPLDSAPQSPAPATDPLSPETIAQELQAAADAPVGDTTSGADFTTPLPASDPVATPAADPFAAQQVEPATEPVAEPTIDPSTVADPVAPVTSDSTPAPTDPFASPVAPTDDQSQPPAAPAAPTAQ